MRILVVDDEPLVAQTLSMIFRKHGFEVDTAYDAVDALRSAVVGNPDLVLCDIDMPGRDGIALMHDLGRELPACPILVLTGHYAGLARVRSTAASLAQKINILTKPCQPLDLLREAGTMLSGA